MNNENIWLGSVQISSSSFSQPIPFKNQIKSNQSHQSCCFCNKRIPLFSQLHIRHGSSRHSLCHAERNTLYEFLLTEVSIHNLRSSKILLGSTQDPLTCVWGGPTGTVCGMPYDLAKVLLPSTPKKMQPANPCRVI